jgi:two-component system, chemotaxis family, protein-glutamate methylesterase/glutaminase
MSGKGAKPPTRVLVVDDSPVARELLAGILKVDLGIEVVGFANDGEQAVREAERLRPDVVVMDIHLPGLDGYGATRRIMESCATRIIMATAASSPSEVAANFRAIEAGALGVIAKPVGVGHPGFAAAAQELVRTVRLMSEVPVVKRWPKVRRVPSAPASDAAAAPVRLVAIGASTGGPVALQRLLSGLPANFAVPLVIVQHIWDSFIGGFAEWLGGTTRLPVRVAADGQLAQPGVAYLAPDGRHMRVRGNAVIELVDGPPEHGVRPSASVLFRSVAEGFGASAVGVLLTGMGRDGARELKTMHDAGAVTFAQDRESSIVFGMPGEAVALGAATHVLPPDRIAAALVDLVARQHPQSRK